MRSRLAFVALAGLFLFGCSSDEKTICERLAECHLLVDGLSESECEDQATQEVSSDRLDKCAECVERENCDRVLDACRKDCEPGD